MLGVPIMLVTAEKKKSPGVGRRAGGWVCTGGWMVESTGKNPNPLQQELYHARENSKNVGFYKAGK